jgi:autotransporter-associated beta strand protein
MTSQDARSPFRHSHQRTGAPRQRSAPLRAILLASSALISVALSATVARAGDATWLANPGSNDFNNKNNWDTTAVPTGIATFGTSLSTAINFTQPTTLGQLSLGVAAGDYTFNNGAFAVTFGAGNGAGVFIAGNSSGSVTLNNANNGGSINFANSSTAGGSTILNNGRLEFDNSSTAGASHITNNGSIFFFNTSNADGATINNNGTVEFHDSSNHSSTARFVMNNGTLDISGLTTAGAALGSVSGSGTISLGSKTLTVGFNGLFADFSGTIADGGTSGGAGGSLEKRGGDTFVLSGTNTYTGATEVGGGTLLVDGSIVKSSGVTVLAFGTLSGNGVVSDTSISGGTLAPGQGPGSVGGALAVHGNLVFNAAATYLLQVSPTTTSGTDVSGTATLGGATVTANFTPGSYVARQYNILNATGGISGTFGSLTNINLPATFASSLSYDNNNVFLNLALGLPNFGSGLNANQRNVANALTNSFNTAGGIPLVFGTLTPADLTKISGETATGTQHTTFDAANTFMGMMIDSNVAGRSGLAAPSGGVSGYAEEASSSRGRADDAFAAIPRKAPLPAELFSPRWSIWAAGFGGSQTTKGNAALGSDTGSSIFGAAAGADYLLSPNTVTGFALAGGGTNFNVANGGSGSSDLFQLGAFLHHTEGAAFVSAALAYSWQDVTTNRTLTIAGVDRLTARFNANAVSGRLEGGYRFSTPAADFTPYAAGQFTTFSLPSYAEQVVFGTNNFALAYNSKNVTATRSEIGLRTEKVVPLGDARLALRGRLAWAHDFNQDSSVTAAFQTLPGSAFTVNGAQAAADSALTTATAEMIWRNGWSATATFEGQFSDTTRSYAGKGAVRYSW